MFSARVTFSACLGVAVGALFTRSAACSASSASLHFCSYSLLDYSVEKKREKIALLGDELWHAMYYAHTNKYGESNVVWDSKCERSVGATVKQRCICCGACPHSPPPSRLQLICTFSTSHICAAHTRLPAHALTTLDTHFPLPLPARTVSLV